MSILKKLTFALLALFLLPAHAQEWPTRSPIQFIVPFPVGGTSDVVARLISDQLTSSLGQAVVVNNRPGVAGTLGTTAVANASADGYTMGLTSVGPIAFAPATPIELGYDPIDSFSHVSIIATTPLVFIVSNAQPAKSVADIVAAAKAEPNKLNFSSSGNASPSHVMLERFKATTGTQITHVPYRGSGPALVDIMAGRIDGTIDTMPSVLPQIQAGQVRALAVSGPERMPQLPDVPTLVELGYPDLVATSWFGVALPDGTPPHIAQRLNKELAAIAELPKLKSQFDKLSLSPLPMSLAETRSFVEEEVGRWRPVIQASGITFQ